MESAPHQRSQQQALGELADPAKSILNLAQYEPIPQRKHWKVKFPPRQLTVPPDISGGKLRFAAGQSIILGYVDQSWSKAFESLNDRRLRHAAPPSRLTLGELFADEFKRRCRYGSGLKNCNPVDLLNYF